MVLLHIILEDMSSQQMLQESNREHRIPYHLLNLVDIRKSVIIPSNRCYQWSIEYSVESVDIMRSYTLSQGYDKY
jgi:hypothetical protein